MGKNIISIFLIVFLLSSPIGCNFSGSRVSGSSDSDSSSTSLSFTMIEQLPRSTSKVVAGSSNASLNFLTASPRMLATTGTSLEDITSSDFNQNTSFAACETANQVKEALQQANEGAQIQCYIQTIFAAIREQSVAAFSGIDIYDGSFHVFNLDDGGNGAPDLIRMKLVRNSSGVITDFVMQACREGQQEMYLHQEINASSRSFSMISKNSFVDQFTDNSETFTFTGQNMADVSGTVNNSGLFEGTKTITLSFAGSMATESETLGSNSARFTFNQQATAGTITGFYTGTDRIYPGATMTFTDQLASHFQLLDNNTSGSTYDFGKIALGDGSALSANTGEVNDQSCSGSHGDDYCSWDSTQQQSWLGEDLSVTSSNDFTESVANATLPDVSDISISFDEDETFNCDASQAEATIDFEELGVDLQTSCEDMDHQRINCWHLSGDGYEGSENNDNNGGGGNGSDYVVPNPNAYLASCDSSADCVASMGERGFCAGGEGEGGGVCSITCESDDVCGVFPEGTYCADFGDVGLCYLDQNDHGDDDEGGDGPDEFIVQSITDQDGDPLSKSSGTTVSLNEFNRLIFNVAVSNSYTLNMATVTTTEEKPAVSIINGSSGMGTIVEGLTYNITQNNASSFMVEITGMDPGTYRINLNNSFYGACIESDEGDQLQNCSSEAYIFTLE